MAERYIYKHSSLWHNRILIRVSITCFLIITAYLSVQGGDETIKDPSMLLYVCGIFVLLNCSDIPKQRKKVRQVVIEGGRLVTLTQDNHKQISFELSEISAKKLIPYKYGFNGYNVEQLLIQVPQKGDFEISSNINSFNRLCKQLLIDDFKSLEVHEP